VKIACIIPARMGSSRFPGKPLAPICGRPMIEHVYRRCSLNRSLDATYVATCDREIAQAAESFGAAVIMTSASHQRASDRVAEAAGKIEADVIVMVQGDEPMVRPEMIDLAVAPMYSDSTLVCTNLAAAIETEAEYRDPNTIKVVMAKNGNALYFSRRPIPWNAAFGIGQSITLKQVAVIPFRRDFLFRYIRLEPTLLETAESIDMLRILEHGWPVRMVVTSHVTHAVDTPSDLALVERLLSGEAAGASP
jgi:3-deoxy-manno-octulosonate cytidylyltransferase (CMP-KDO synthetase)